MALSYLTPGLSRRIQKQLLAQLTPDEVKKLRRTLSSKTSDELDKPQVDRRRSIDRICSTLPRKSSVDKEEKNLVRNAPKSFLPVIKYPNNKEEYRPYEFSVRSSSSGAEPRGNFKFTFSRPKVARSVSTREPRMSRIDLHSPESSISESLSKNDDTSSSYKKDTDSFSSKYSDSSSSRPYSRYSNDSSYTRYTPGLTSPHVLSPTSSEPPKIDKKLSNASPRRISRFLRPDFFESKEDNVYLKEKKERERETQQVLKEIRDKRKSRLRSRSRGRSDTDDTRSKTPSRDLESPAVEEVILKTTSNEQALNDYKEKIQSPSPTKNIHDYVNVPAPNTCISPKNLEKELENKTEESVKPLHDYVNVSVKDNTVTPVKKESRISKIARPKSYPNENIERTKVKPENVAEKPEKPESKISKLKKGFGKKDKQSKEDKNETNKNINEEDKAHKNKLLQSIEKKLEKFRSNNITAVKDPDEAKALLDKKSMVESAIKRLREQSLPRNLEPCTESGLIKRAVSVEDLAVGTKSLQASKKSVTKILGLFKKYEEQDKKKEKPTKKSKSKEEKKSKEKRESVEKQSVEVEKPEKKERPKSLFLDKMKHFQQSYNGARSDSVLDQVETNNVKTKSKLPVNSFRRSLNLDNLPEPPKFNKNPSNESLEVQSKPDRRNLRLDFSRIPSRNAAPVIVEPAKDKIEEPSHDNRLSSTTDDSSTILSPTEDYLSCDSWSACSDFHHLSDLHSPQSHNGHSLLYSGDEGESVSDRIRRKSFYTRFNEKKRPTRKPSLVGAYKDLDLYKDYGSAKPDYNSLDRYRSPSVSRRPSFNSYIPEVNSPSSSSTPREHKTYSRTSSNASVLNDYVNVPGGHQLLTHTYQNVPNTHQSLIGSYQNLPGSYQTYSSRIARPSSVTRGIYPDSESHLDDLLSSANSKRRSPYSHRSALDRGSVSPLNESYYSDRASHIIQSPTTSEPI